MIKIYLVDDHQIVRHGVKNLLETNPDFIVVGESDKAQDYLEFQKTSEVDLIISDITMASMNGIDFLKLFKKTRHENTKFLILSMHADYLYINQCFEEGANGYLLKDFKKSELFSAVDKIMRGDIYISPSASQVLANNYLNKEFTNRSSVGAKIEVTKREKEIIELISLGFSNKEIAGKLFISVSTVDVHRYNILKKLEVKNSAEMLMKAIKLKILNHKM
jgi:DNA-binding NarL/FixJ family response regulator